MNGMLPEIRTSEPNSPIERAKASAIPERIAGRQVREDDPPEGRQRAGAERRGGLLHVLIELEQDRLHRPDHERQGHEQERHDDADAGERDPREAEDAVVAVERQQRDPGDDRRQRERQVDQRVDDPLAGELVTDEHPGDDRAGNRVDRDHDRRGYQGQLQRRDRLRRGDVVPERRKAALERLRDDRCERDQDDQAQVPDHESPGEPGAAEAEPQARPRRCLGSCDGPLTHSVATPRFCSISAIEPFSGSKKSVVTWSQPPRSSIVNRSGGSRELVRVLLRTPTRPPAGSRCRPTAAAPRRCTRSRRTSAPNRPHRS